jgi:transposase InsO family protein
MDFHGPLVPSNGKRYILVLIDSTSMWVELIPVADTTAETAVRALYDNVIARFGVPKGLSVLTDNGSAFIAQLTKLFCKTFGIKQYFTSPYHAQTNVRAEQVADTIHNSLRALCREQSEWATHLQAVAMSYRATPTSNTGLSLYETIFGQPMRLNIDWTMPTADLTVTSAQQYAKEIAPKLEVLHKIAMENATDSTTRHRLRHDQKAMMP